MKNCLFIKINFKHINVWHPVVRIGTSPPKKLWYRLRVINKWWPMCTFPSLCDCWAASKQCVMIELPGLRSASLSLLVMFPPHTTQNYWFDLNWLLRVGVFIWSSHALSNWFWRFCCKPWQSHGWEYWICSVRVTVPGYTAEESVRSVGILWPL